MSTNLQTLKTYLVEDSPVILRDLVATLEELAPVKVIGTAEHEQSAVGWLGNLANPVDLVIIDIFLKSGSGLGVLKSIHGLRPAAKLVVLTNYATPDMHRKCMALGADRVFDKSNDIDALIQYCNRLAGVASQS
jgi:DNA-binding NarL/FixJ family response regulator